MRRSEIPTNYIRLQFFTRSSQVIAINITYTDVKKKKNKSVFLVNLAPDLLKILQY